MGNVVRTCLLRNMWKRSRSAYLKEPLDSPASQLATALLKAAGRFVRDWDEVISQDMLLQ